MAGLPCLVSQCAKLHVAGWTWAAFTCICLESCSWPVVIFMMDQRKEQRVCIKFCTKLGKSARDSHNDSTSLRGSKLESCTGVSMACPVAHQLTMTDTKGDPEAAQLLQLLHEFKSSSIKINIRPFTTLLRRWELVMRHANRFWRKNWASTVSQPNLRPGSWQLTRSSSALTSALNFVSLLPMMKHSCPGSSLVIRAGFTVMTLRQSNNPPSGKAPCHQGQKRPDRWKAMSRAWSSLSLRSRGLCTKNLSQQAKLLIPGSTATFCGECMKTCEDVAPNFGKNRPGCFTMTTPHLTFPSSPSSFWWKLKWLSSPTHRTTLIWHPVTSSYFQIWNWSWKDAGLIPMRRYRPNHGECLTLW